MREGRVADLELDIAEPLPRGARGEVAYGERRNLPPLQLPRAVGGRIRRPRPLLRGHPPPAGRPRPRVHLAPPPSFLHALPRRRRDAASRRGVDGHLAGAEGLQGGRVEARGGAGCHYMGILES
jgi:hypothetical protein